MNMDDDVRQDTSGDAFYRRVVLTKKIMGQFKPLRTRDSMYIDSLVSEHFECYHIMPKDHKAKRVIFYLYDSNFCYRIKHNEWNFCLELMRMTDSEIIIPAYPLAPEHGCEEVYNFLIPAYSKLMSEYDNRDIILMGNGAGGCLALSLSLMLWKEGIGAPAKIVLLSPILDTEFFDLETEAEMMEWKLGNLKKYIVRCKKFINDYWVRDFAGRTEYTSPIYEDFNELDSRVLVISGTEDIYNIYARKFVQKYSDTGKKALFFEYKGMKHNFYLGSHNKCTRHMLRVMQDFIREETSAILDEYMFEVKERGDWAKRYPEIFKDDYALRYLVNHKLNLEKYKRSGYYSSLMDASSQAALDRAVSTFIHEYPDGTVVYIGCSLDTMFSRVDNGRVMWYNLDSPGRMAVRAMYTEPHEREKSILRSVNDYKWFDDIECDSDKGLLFVFRDVFCYWKETEVKELLELMYDRFRGSNIIFDIGNQTNMIFANLTEDRGSDFRLRKSYINDPNIRVADWSPSYMVVSSDSVLEGVKSSKSWKRSLRILFAMARKLESRKIVHLKLGYEKYEIVQEIGPVI